MFQKAFIQMKTKEVFHVACAQITRSTAGSPDLRQLQVFYCILFYCVVIQDINVYISKQTKDTLITDVLFMIVLLQDASNYPSGSINVLNELQHMVSPTAVCFVLILHFRWVQKLQCLLYNLYTLSRYKIRLAVHVRVFVTLQKGTMSYKQMIDLGMAGEQQGSKNGNILHYCSHAM